MTPLKSKLLTDFLVSFTVAVFLTGVLIALYLLGHFEAKKHFTDRGFVQYEGRVYIVSPAAPTVRIVEGKLTRVERDSDADDNE